MRVVVPSSRRASDPASICPSPSSSSEEKTDNCHRTNISHSGGLTCTRSARSRSSSRGNQPRRAISSPARSADSRVIDERYQGKRSAKRNEDSKGHRQRDHAVGKLERKSRRQLDTGRITPRSAAIIVSDDVEE